MTALTCDACAQPARFLDCNDECPECAKTNPAERVAIALFNDFIRDSPWPSATWDAPALDDATVRDKFRSKASLALTAAIDEAELAEHIGHHHAHIVAVHFLGSEAAT